MQDKVLFLRSSVLGNVGGGWMLDLESGREFLSAAVQIGVAVAQGGYY